MNNSNYTLRFSRTSREAFGHDITFKGRVDCIEEWVWFAAGLVFGLIAGMAI